MLLIFTHFCRCSKVVTVHEEPFTRETLAQYNKNDIVLFHCVVLIIYMIVTLHAKCPQILR